MLPEDLLVNVVSQDLRWLRDQWNQSIDDTSLRLSSPVLRRLLVHGELQRAWKAAGFQKEPQISASSLATVLSQLSHDKIIFAAAGGARYNGIEIRGVLCGRFKMEIPEMEAIRSRGLPEETLGLRTFIKAPCLVVQGHLVPRRVLVKYVVNKLGGAHYDAGRSTTPEERLFRELDWAQEPRSDRTFYSLCGGDNEQILQLIDSGEGGIRLAGKSIIYFELLAAGQALARSSDLTELINLSCPTNTSANP